MDWKCVGPVSQRRKCMGDVGSITLTVDRSSINQSILLLFLKALCFFSRSIEMYLAIHCRDMADG